MTVQKWHVEGHDFVRKSDYEKALRDQRKIQILKQKLNFKDKNNILSLYQSIQSKKIQFESILGEEFAEEVYNLVREIRAGTFGTDKIDIKPKDYKKIENNIIVLTEKEYRTRKYIKIFLFLIAVICLGYFGLYYTEAVRKDQEQRQMAKLKENEALNAMGQDEVVVHKASDDEKDYVVLEKYKTLFKNNKNLIGWLKIDDTLIDYPVMQAKDNLYYLDHNTKQEKDKNGSLFLDKDCSIANPSTNLIIYGHHMKSGKMFGQLDDYKKETFYKKHPFISFDTLYEEGTYEVMYIFLSKIYYEEEITFKYYQFIEANSEEEFNSNMAEMAKMSLYDTGVTAQYGDQLLTLSTCDYGREDGRFVVVAKKVN